MQDHEKMNLNCKETSENIFGMSEHYTCISILMWFLLMYKSWYLFSRWLKKEEEAQVATKEFNTGPKLDLGFKEGQTITINVAKVFLCLNKICHIKTVSNVPYNQNDVYNFYSLI